MDVDTIIIRKKEILTEINIHQKKLITLETELLSIEKMMANFSEMNISDSLSLSDQQKIIVESKDKNILVVACPGSGKTHTLISRYIHLVTKEKVKPENIIMITFTKKAGMEMNQRIGNILPNKLPYYVGSLHGLGFRLLQEYNKINYTVLDENDSHIIMRKCADLILIPCTDLTDDEVSLIRRQIVYIYDKISTNYPPDVNEAIKHLSIPAKYKTIINNILKEYKNEKKRQNLIDFNDLMIQFCQLLGTKKIADFINNIKYVFFDEYQDINPVQNYILSCFGRSPNSSIMVVGDDAQAIYAFRGSSVQYIWDFEKNFENVKTYYLETNYRSTPSIVNYFQDIISHNVNQFKKNVKSNQTENGLKPYIMCHNTNVEQYKWVADDIAKKYKSGISLREMVVLSRKNSSLDMLEHELLLHSIPVIKSIGISLLNKQHIKDFIAFLIILTNPKSIIHWKRILSLHKGIGIARANEIIDDIETNGTVIEAIKSFIEDNPNITSLHSLNDFLKSLKNKQIKEQIQMIQFYLINLWEMNHNNSKNINLEARKNDLVSLLMFMNKQSIEEFISNIHLNLEIDTIEDSLFLSTVHGSKGLEWEHVYIIDMDCKNFPNVRQSYYKDEMDNVMEERRLFYVAASRAKKYLCINFYQDISMNTMNYVVVSPFIRELDETNYIGSNLTKSLNANYALTGNISMDVNNYLRYNGYKSLSEMVLEIPSIRENIGLKIELPVPTTLKNRIVVGNMMDCLVSKILHNNFNNNIQNFDINQNNNKLPEKIYHDYIDPYNDWRNILNEIFFISTYKNSNKIDNLEEWKEYLCINNECSNYYSSIEKCIIKLVNSLFNNNSTNNNSMNNINIHTNITMNPIKGEIDFMVNDTLIEMKTTPDDACTFPNVCQALMYGYLLKKKNININTIIILNLWDGTIDRFNVSEFNFIKFKKILYNVK
jgi:DNA helicase-2/ATP-dependent DNA helicase PcrA